MPIDYARMEATATRLLTQNGTTHILTRGEHIIRDPNGGEVVTMPSSYSVTGIITEFTLRERESALIQAGDRKLIATSAIEIMTDDRVTVDGKSWRVVSVTAMKPAATLLCYSAQLRV